jgi:hypothetical protein
MIPEETEEESPEDLRLQINHLKDDLVIWKNREDTKAQEITRLKYLLEVSEEKFRNLRAILDRYPPPAKSARQTALELAVQCSGPMDEDDVLKTAARFEMWLINPAKAPADGGHDL